MNLMRKLRVKSYICHTKHLSVYLPQTLIHIAVNDRPTKNDVRLTIYGASSVDLTITTGSSLFPVVYSIRNIPNRRSRGRVPLQPVSIRNRPSLPSSDTPDTLSTGSTGWTSPSSLRNFAISSSIVGHDIYPERLSNRREFLPHRFQSVLFHPRLLDLALRKHASRYIELIMTVIQCSSKNDICTARS